MDYGEGDFKKMMNEMQEFRRHWQQQQQLQRQQQQQQPVMQMDSEEACRCECARCKAATVLHTSRNVVAADLRSAPVDAPAGQPLGLATFLVDSPYLVWVLLGANLAMMLYGLNTMSKLHALLQKFGDAAAVSTSASAMMMPPPPF